MARRKPISRTWVAQEVALLGTRSDRWVAMQVGASVPVVQRKRIKLGIAKWQPPTDHALKKRQPPAPDASFEDVWTEDCLDLLGYMTDENLALLMGIEKSEVRFQRIWWQIPIYRET